MIQLAYTQAALSLLVLVVAVLTANAARFVAMVLLLVFAWMCCFITFLAHSPDVPVGVTQTRALAGVVLSLAVIALVVGASIPDPAAGTLLGDVLRRFYPDAGAGELLALGLVALGPLAGQ